MMKDDILWGVRAISEFLGIPQRTVFYLAEKGRLPGVFKQGSRWVGLKSKIREGYEKLADGEGDLGDKN